MNSIKVIKRSISAGAFGVTMLATKAFAQSGTVKTGVDEITPVGTSTNTLQQYIQIVINVLLGTIGVVAVIMLIIGGFRYVLSQGDEKATKGAKDTILFAIVILFDDDILDNVDAEMTESTEFSIISKLFGLLISPDCL